MNRTAAQPRTAPRPPARARLLVVVVAGALGLWLLSGAQASAAPVISGGDGDVWNAANPVPTYVITTDAPNRKISWSVAGVASGTGRSPLRVRLSGLGDGQYRLAAMAIILGAVVLLFGAFAVSVLLSSVHQFVIAKLPGSEGLASNLLNPGRGTLVVDGGVGFGTSEGEVAGRAGATFGW